MHTRALWTGRAGPDDDPALRRLLRETPMEGAVSIAFAREPSFFHAAAVEGHTDTVVAREPDGRVVGMFCRSVRSAWVDGAPRRLPYLSALRIDPKYRLRPGLLRRGFDEVRKLADADPDALPWSITTIVSDNAPARRLLEANLRGFPRYTPQEELITFAAPTWRERYRPVPGVEVRAARPDDLGDLVELLARWGREHQYGPVWDAATLADPLRCRGLSVEDFTLAARGGRLVGAVARWDQQGFKQSVVCGYTGPLRWARRGVNALAPWLGVPRLPEPGAELRHAYLSHLAVADHDPAVARAVLGAAHDSARPRRYDTLTWMLAARHPLAPVCRAAFRPMEYRSMLYVAAWDPVDRPSDRIAGLEVAVM
ncbi:MAG: hypothetical protein ABMA64_08795 [Myxococcota bacterium]